MRLRSLLLLGALVLLAGCNTIPATAVPTTTPVVKPGGLWISPANGATVSGPIHFAARAYPTRAHIDPGVAFVEFTVSWEGRPGPWVVACKVERPTFGDTYECSWDPSTYGEKVPSGRLNISFDVYDRAVPPDVNLAPNGTHSIIWNP